MKSQFLVLVFIALFSAACNQEKKPVNTASLLSEMVDKDALTRFPDPYYSTKQFSSYDRRSSLETKDSYLWFANADHTQFLRSDTTDGRVEHVLFDAEGPGAVVRIWMTGGGYKRGEGILRFYFDHDSIPEIEGPAFKVISDGTLAGYPLSASVSEDTGYGTRGHNLYLPLPYSRHCKITYESEGIHHPDQDKSELFYYNINYRTYEENTLVETFQLNALDSLKGFVEKVNKQLLNGNAVQGAEQKFPNQHVPPGETVDFEIQERGKAIQQLEIQMEADDFHQALRSVVVKIEFDGKETVWVPVGEFFGTSYSIHPNATWNTEVAESGKMKSSWVMPFRESSKISFVNLGDGPVDISADIHLKEYEWTDNSMYFGSSWKLYEQIATGGNKGRDGEGQCLDLDYVTLKGEGVYVGDVLSIYNPVLPGHWKSWWGEGDEKIYVDGEDFPSHFGTGTEDYYGYAWCRPEKFSNPFIAQPIGEGNLTSGLTVNARMRLLDGIPFKKSIDVDMELWHWVKTKVDYSPTVFYYVLPGSVPELSKPVESARQKVALKSEDILKSKFDENGLLEGEDLKVETSNANVHGVYGDNLSGGLALGKNYVRTNESTRFNFGAGEDSRLKQLALSSQNDGDVYELILNGNPVLKWESRNISEEFNGVVELDDLP
ncbi:glycoside hydrolase family 172 protein, partial [Echinicola sediminis]